MIEPLPCSFICGHDRAAAEEDAGEVDGDDRVPLPSVKCSIGAAFAMPALLTSTSTAAEGVDSGVDDGIPLLFGRDIEVHEPRPVAEHGDERRALVVEHVGDDHPGARGMKRAHVGLADAAGSAGDDRDPAVELGQLRHPAS